MEDSATRPDPEPGIHIPRNGALRDGAEVVDTAKSNRKPEKGRESELNTKGTFGPILASVLMTAARGQSTVNWDHW